MTTQPSQMDLFGNSVADHHTAPKPTTPANDGVNNMDLVQAVLTDLTDKKSAALHIDDTGQVSRCAGVRLTPVTPEVATVITQLLGSGHCATRQRSCPGHGAQITVTRAGRDALHRWQALHRPSTWTTTPNTTTNNKELT